MKLLFSILLVMMIGAVACPLEAGEPDPVVRYTVSGYIRDGLTGEVLIGATVYIKELKTGTTSNLYGFYSISLKPGLYEVSYAYLGYQSVQKQMIISANIQTNIDLIPANKRLEEVVIRADRPELHVKRNEMSVERLDMKTIRQIPAFMGEVDVLKAIQLLPGVISTSEGTSAFSVRGGSNDQNLILLDESTVYNASHLMGFFSVFNNDAIKDIKLYKGDIPAAYGGRLSSLLEVNMKDGNQKKFSGNGGAGLISSRLTLEGPLAEDKSSFIVSGRRTYADLFLPLSGNKDIRNNRLYFYDLNLKTNYRINQNNRVFLSGYFGNDVFKNQFASMGFGNGTLTLRWNHLFSQKHFSHLAFIYSKYNYELGMDAGGTTFLWKYFMQDVGVKVDFTYYATPGFTVKYGLQSVYHSLNPGEFSTSGENQMGLKIPSDYSLEHGVYLAIEQNITPKFSLKYGLRYSLFQNIGKATVYRMNSDYEVMDSVVYGSGKVFNHYGNIEPRAGMKYEINDLTSIKGSYTRTRQYMQMATNSTAGTPMDLWFTASPNVRPQVSDMFAVGLFRNFRKQTLETSVEVYYKEMQNTIDFRDHAQLYGNPRLEAELRFGRAKSYGIETMVQFPSTRLNGWVSYTYSHTERKIATINNGNAYLAPYDKPHTVNIVLNFEISKRLDAGATWVYATGAPLTVPRGRAVEGNVIYPTYTDRNTYRMPDYHRLDLSVTLKGRYKEGRLWQGDWNFSVYNAYMRKNAWIIRFVQDDKDPNRTKAEKFYLFSIIPSITYNFKF